MKKLVLPFLLALSFALHAQSELDAWMGTSGAACFSKDAAKKELKSFLDPLLSSGIAEQKLLHKAFQRLHSTYFKKYEPLSDFNEVFTSGRYDCLTATALLSHVLDELKFPYQIIETNYHIFVMVKTSGGDVLLETTDRWNGFVTDKDAIAKRISGYQENEIASNDSKKVAFQYSFKLYQTISPQKLTGLLYYNQSVKAFNRHDIIASSSFLKTSHALYDSPRCSELGVLLLQTVMESSMDDAAKATCMINLKNVLVKKSSSVAAN